MLSVVADPSPMARHPYFTPRQYVDVFVATVIYTPVVVSSGSRITNPGSSELTVWFRVACRRPELKLGC